MWFSFSLHINHNALPWICLLLVEQAAKQGFYSSVHLTEFPCVKKKFHIFEFRITFPKCNTFGSEPIKKNGTLFSFPFG